MPDLVKAHRHHGAVACPMVSSKKLLNDAFITLRVKTCACPCQGDAHTSLHHVAKPEISSAAIRLQLLLALECSGTPWLLYSLLLLCKSSYCSCYRSVVFTINETLVNQACYFLLAFALVNVRPGNFYINRTKFLIILVYFASSYTDTCRG